MINFIPEKDFNAKQTELADLMSEISEDCYCAGWIHGNEARLWDALQPGDDLRYGMGEIDKTALERVRQLSQELDGWIVFWSPEYDKTVQWGDDDCGLIFISLGDWRRLRDTVWTKPKAAA